MDARWAAFAAVAVAGALSLGTHLGRSEPAPGARAADDWDLAALLLEVESMRGLEFLEEVRVERLDGEGVARYVDGALERAGGATRLGFLSESAQMFGLMPAGRDLWATYRDLLTGQIAGLYDPPTGIMYVVEGLDPLLARVTLAHELVHALDDQHHRLGAAMDARLLHSDRLWAYQAVAEGSASLVHNRWMMENLASFDAQSMQRIAEMGSKGMADAPEFLWKPLLGSYLAGASFLVGSSNLGRGQTGRPRPGDVERAFAEPPRSSEQVLHPEKYWNAEQRDEPLELRFRADSIPEGWTHVGEDTLGELGLALVTSRPSTEPFQPARMLQLRFTNRAATGWGGDRHVLLRRGAERLLVAELHFDTAEDATECMEALSDLAPWRAGVLKDFAGTLPRGEESGAEPWFSGEWTETRSERALRWVLAVGADEAELRSAAGALVFEPGEWIPGK